jgi:hypothetical protein
MTRDRLLRADELGVRLEIVNGQATRAVAPQDIALKCGCRVSV